MCKIHWFPNSLIIQNYHVKTTIPKHTPTYNLCFEWDWFQLTHWTMQYKLVSTRQNHIYIYIYNPSPFPQHFYFHVFPVATQLSKLSFYWTNHLGLFRHWPHQGELFCWGIVILAKDHIVPIWWVSGMMIKILWNIYFALFFNILP